MAVTRISDIITPDAWQSYGVNRTTELSALWTSGIVQAVAGITLPNGGGTVNLPHFNALTGDAEVLDDATALTPGAIGTGKQVSVVLGRGRAWGVNDLAGLLAGADPARAIMDLLAAYWAGQMQTEVIKTLTGLFAASGMSGLVHDVTALTGTTTIAGVAQENDSINAYVVMDAAQKMGDAKNMLTALAMHSATENYLAKQQLIAYVPTADGMGTVPMYQRKRVIVDDSLPVASGVYTSYLFGPGAIGYADGIVGKAGIESDRDILAGDDVMTMRRRFILHPVGAKWVGTAAGDFPTRTELATGTNWNRVYDVKKIPIVQIKHNLT